MLTFAADSTRIQPALTQWRTSRSLLERLKAEHFGMCPATMMRRCQRRPKEWRREAALGFAFGTEPAGIITSGSANECSATPPSGVVASPTTPPGPKQPQFSLIKRSLHVRAENIGQPEHVVDATSLALKNSLLRRYEPPL